MLKFSTLITSWYRLSARDLPWRNTKNPYFIWLSEIILQQTRVDQGKSYYEKFIQHYPTIKDLATASEDQVLNDWQGLGYYSRARNLHAAAKYITNDLNGEFPNSYDSIIQLKGVGEYTASAIASFAFNEPTAVVDGNVYRLLSRYFDIDTAIDTTEGKKTFKKLADELIDPKNPAEHNQAIMEMGAVVCTPKQPNCENCPLNESCLGFANKSYDRLPVKSKKIKVRKRYFHYLIFDENGKTLLRKRGPNDVWQGLYDFPLIEYKREQGISKEDQEQFGLKEMELQYQAKHVLSHQQLFAKFWLVKSNNYEHIAQDYLQVERNQLDDYPMPQLLIRYLESQQ